MEDTETTRQGQIRQAHGKWVRFTPKEDAKIIELHTGLENETIQLPKDYRFRWQFIADEVNKISEFARTEIQCLDRWRHYLNPDIDKQWTTEEDELLKKLYSNRNVGLPQIHKYFPNKTKTGVRNRIFILKKRNRQISQYSILGQIQFQPHVQPVPLFQIPVQPAPQSNLEPSLNISQNMQGQIPQNPNHTPLPPISSLLNPDEFPISFPLNPSQNPWRNRNTGGNGMGGLGF